MRIISIFLSMLFFSSVVFAGALDDVKSAGKFVFGLEVGYKPFEYMDDSGNLVGYDIDVANEIGKRLGVDAVSQDTNWSTVIQTMYDGGFDLILGGMTATEKRYQRVNFSIPYMNAASGIIVLKDSGISDRSDLDGKKVSAGAGTPQLDQLNISADEWHEPARNLSIGQQQRIAIARSLINKPQLLIADEPTSSLDHANRDIFMSLLMNIVEEHKITLLLVSHDMSLSAHFSSTVSLNEINRIEEGG